MKKKYTRGDLKGIWPSKRSEICKLKMTVVNFLPSVLLS